MIKVVHTVTSYQSVKTILYSKLKGLGNYQELNVSVISSLEDEQDNSSSPVRHIKVNIARSIKPIQDIKSIYQMYKVLKSEKFDIVHSHTAKAGFITAFAAKLAKVPIICHTSHGLPFFEGQNKISYFLYYYLEKLACKCRHFIFTQNKKDLDACIKLMGDKEKVAYEGNGVDIDFVTESAKGQLEKALNVFPDNNSLKISLLSRLEPVKRVKDFIEIIKKAKEKGLTFSCVIAGDGILKNDLENLIRESNLKDNINLIGFCSYPHGLILNSDLVVLCSEKEGIPRSIMEAMALKKPVVATDVMGTQEVVVNNETGFLIPLGNTDKFLDKIIELANDPELRIKMGQAGKKRVIENFNDVKIAQFLKNFYISHCRK